MEFSLSLNEIREVTAFAVACARSSLAVFENHRPGDSRPRDALDAAQAFADGGPRTKAIRDGAWAALRAAGEARDKGLAAAGEAARAAVAAAGSAYLHPLAKSTQVKHILGAAAHSALALEADGVDRYRRLATPAVVDVLRRYPSAPSGGKRAGALMRQLDAALRVPSG